MPTVLAQKTYTVEEYLAMECNAFEKSEFRDGYIYAMTGASWKHNLVAINIPGELRSQLKNRACET